MTLRQATIQCKNGLHLKVAGEVARTVQRSSCRVWFVSRKDEKIDASSVLQLLTLGARHGTKLKIFAEGNDRAEEENVIEAVFKIIQNPYEEA
jgi:phosphocarrier protein